MPLTLTCLKNPLNVSSRIKSGNIATVTPREILCLLWEIIFIRVKWCFTCINGDYTILNFNNISCWILKRFVFWSNEAILLLRTLNIFIFKIFKLYQSVKNPNLFKILCVKMFLSICFQNLIKIIYFLSLRTWKLLAHW